MLRIDFETAERLVTLRNDMYWDGWTIVHVKPNPIGWLKPNGIMHKGKWHVQRRYSLDESGQYTVPKAFGNGL